jgi:hypothetical protein
VSSNPGREDCEIAGILMMNMWSKLYILVLQYLFNLAQVRRVRVNNEVLSMETEAIIGYAKVLTTPSFSTPIRAIPDPVGSFERILSIVVNN